MRKKIICIVLSLLLLLGLVGCDDKAVGNSYDIFYLNLEMTKILSESHQISVSNDNPEEVVSELLNLLKQSPDDSDLRKTIPDNIKIYSIKEDSGIVIDFSEEYKELLPTEEVLIRAAIVRTLSQIKNYSYVSFLVEGEPLTNQDGSLVGYMDQASFVENPGKQINSILQKNLTLYFADKTGTKLIKENRTVHYSTNKSLEKVVLEELIAGPNGSGQIKSTIPAGTNIVSVSVVDGICYVNFDEAFQNNLDNSLNEQVILYSIVDSLTSLSGVEKVQISINGETKGKLKYNYELSSMYEFDDSIISDTKSNSDKNNEKDDKKNESIQNVDDSNSEELNNYIEVEEVPKN